MSTAEWLALLGTLVTFAVGYGALQAKVAALREMVNELKAGRQRTSDRLEKLERFDELIKFASPRLNTSAIGIPVADESGPTKGGG